jgi:hypothetical protein
MFRYFQEKKGRVKADSCSSKAKKQGKLIDCNCITRKIEVSIDADGATSIVKHRGTKMDTHRDTHTHARAHILTQIIKRAYTTMCETNAIPRSCDNSP